MVYKKGIKQIFRGSVPVYQDAILPALVFKDNNDIKRIANLGADYEYGRTSWAMFHTTLKKWPNVEVVGEAWAPFFTADFTPHLSALASKKPDLIFATPWAGEAVLMLRQATTLGIFNDIKVWWQAMGGSVDVMEGISRDVITGKFKDKLWATARYIWNWPDTPENKAFVWQLLRTVGPAAELFGGMHLLGDLRIEGGSREGWLRQDSGRDQGAGRPQAFHSCRQARLPAGRPSGRIMCRPGG